MAGNPNPIDAIGGISSSSNVSKGDFSSWGKVRVPQVVDDAAELRGFDLSGQHIVLLFSTGAIYLSDVADTTTSDDGINCIRDANGVAFKIVEDIDPAFPDVREVLSADRTYFVRTDGSDSNNGLANTAGGAFLTINKAVAALDGIDLNGFTVTIQVADGTYTGGLALQRAWLGGALVIQGNIATPANCLISTTSKDAISVGGMGLAAPLTIQGFKLQTTTSGYGINAFAPGTLTLGPMEYGAVASGYDHIIATSAASVVLSGNYKISGGAARHYNVATQGILSATNMTVTITGSPAFTSAFAAASSSGVLTAFGQTFSGTPTGVRYSSTLNAVNNTLGGGANYFPGNSAGSTATGGQYA